MTTTLLSRSLLALALFALPVSAQWDPANAQWGKTDPADLRVMTWNMLTTFDSQEFKGEGLNKWTGMARIIASIKPDVLILQETGTLSGSVDSVANLETLAELLVHGGPDPFIGGTVTAYLQKYDPSYDLPHVLVSTVTDGFNRNTILSRYPFVDINGDGKATLVDMPFTVPDAWSPGGNGGIRGLLTAEIDLPDATYAGDLAIHNSHLKSGSSASDKAARLLAAKNISYFLWYWYEGAGTGTADPNNKIAGVPDPSTVIGPDDLLMAGGDWNEDEATNGTKGPADWISKADQGGTIDGPDKDGTDMTFDSATEFFSGAGNSHSGGSKLDYLSWQDSVATLRRDFIFYSAAVPAASMPPELAGASNASLLSQLASDHRPVVVDLILPAGGGGVTCGQSTTDLGFAKAGTGGLEPVFEVCGTLQAGDFADFVLEDAAPNSLAFAVIGFVSNPVPFKGGMLVPSPPIFVASLPTGPAGTFSIPVDGGLGPATLVMQWAIADNGAPQNTSLSNALAIVWS